MVVAKKQAGKEMSFFKGILSGRQPLFHESIKQTKSLAVREANMTIYISSSPWSTPSCSESRSVPKEKDEAKPQRLDYRVGPLFSRRSVKVPKIGLLSRLRVVPSLGRKWKVFEYRRPSIDRSRIRIDSEKANLSRSGHSPDMGIPFRKARLEKSPIELATEDVKKSTALALHKGIPDSVNSLVDIETKSH